MATTIVDGDGNNTIVDGTITITPIADTFTPGTDEFNAIAGNGDNTIMMGYGLDMVRVGDGNNSISSYGPGFFLAGNGNDQFFFLGSNDIVQAGTGHDTVTLGLNGGNNYVSLGAGTGDMIEGSLGRDIIFASGLGTEIDGNGGGDIIRLGGQHEDVEEHRSNHGPLDRIYFFTNTDSLSIEGFGTEPHWFQGPHGVLFVNHHAVADVLNHHLHAYNLLFS